MAKVNTVNLGFWAILLASIFWGTTGTAAAFAPNLSPLTIGAVAMGGSGLLQALLAWRHIAAFRDQIRANIGLLILGAISVAIYPLAFYSSMHLAGITVGTVVSIGSAPLFSAVLEWAFEKKKLSRRWILSFIFGALGIGLLTLAQQPQQAPQFSENQLPYQQYYGIALGLLAALTYACYAWVAKMLISKGFHSKAAIGLVFGCGAILLIPIAVMTGGNIFDAQIHLWVLLYMVFIPMFLGYLLFGYGLKTVPASQAVTLTLFEPVVAAIFAMLVVKEQLSLLGWCGIALIGLCLILQSKTAEQ
ncbi:DMT family transporter [Acinetobacter larvae]|uniref:EamA family transporter n=1 Tax=Acinetobacter larvae TaxID=1789224 RepID=A0A1B2LYV3_9GAMM|nr:EamA family transporter [Acinetobacter larvae]AOA58106.1 EamA family transporter [Acinetobacter larvae]